MDSLAISCNLIGKLYGVDGDLLERQYKEHLSGFRHWDQLDHAEDWILYPGNIGPRLSIDETSLSNGELYTILTNKSAKGKKGRTGSHDQGYRCGNGKDCSVKDAPTHPMESQGNNPGYGAQYGSNSQAVFSTGHAGNRPVSCTKTLLRCPSGRTDKIPLAGFGSGDYRNSLCKSEGHPL